LSDCTSFYILHGVLLPLLYLWVPYGNFRQVLRLTVTLSGRERQRYFPMPLSRAVWRTAVEREHRDRGLPSLMATACFADQGKFQRAADQLASLEGVG